MTFGMDEDPDEETLMAHRVAAFNILKAQIPLMDHLDLVDLYGLVLGELHTRSK